MKQRNEYNVGKKRVEGKLKLKVNQGREGSAAFRSLEIYWPPL